MSPVPVLVSAGESKAASYSGGRVPLIDPAKGLHLIGVD